MGSSTIGYSSYNFFRKTYRIHRSYATYRSVVVGNLLLEPLLSVVLSLLLINEVELVERWAINTCGNDDGTVEATYALGLELAVDEGTGETSENLLCFSMAVRLAVCRTMVFIGLHSLFKQSRQYEGHQR